MQGLDWDVLTRYLAGAGSPAERERVERWLAESAANRQILEDVRRGAALADEGATADRQSAILASLKREWTLADRDEAAPPRFAVSPSPWPVAARVAAAVALLIGGAGAGALILRRPPIQRTALPHPASITVATARGERRSLRLADGTLVTLAPASTLRIPPAFGARERTVELDGQAVFSVTHDSIRPFAVRTSDAIARDLGTRFAVRAYADEPATDVVVAEGAVAVARSGAGKPTKPDSVIVRRGQRARVASDSGVALSSGVSLDGYFAWADGQLVFRDTPLREAAAQLGRWFAIDVKLASQAIAARRLTASFRDEPAPEALRVVASVLDLEITQLGTTYILRAR